MKHWLDHVVDHDFEWHPDGFIQRPITRAEWLRDTLQPFIIWAGILALVASLVYLGSH